MPSGRVTVFGGTGFLGGHVVGCLTDAGRSVRVAARRAEPHRFRHAGTGVEYVQADVRDEASVAAAIEGAQGVVNAVGLYAESGGATFDAVHVDGARYVARQSTNAGARLVHISGIGADRKSRSRYVRARAEGERVVRAAAPDAVILRPSVLFGRNDGFVNSLAALVQRSPVVPLFASGATRLQPVYVEDVATAVMCVLVDVEAGGNVYELGGPRVYAYRELFEILMRRLGRRRWLLPVPFIVWELLAVIAVRLPNPAFTVDQVILMRADNVVASKTGTFQDLGIVPQSLEDTLTASLTTEQHDQP